MGLPKPAKRAHYKDKKVPFLSLMITSTGAKSYKVRKRSNNRFVNVTLGKYDEITIEQARKKAVEVISLITSGVNPNEEKKKIRTSITFGEMNEEYIEHHCKAHRKDMTTDTKDIPKHCKHLWNRKADSVTTKELQALHTKIALNNGKYQANRVTDGIRAMYNKHIIWGWDGKNPALGIQRFKEKSRERFLLPEEMPRFINALEMEENQTAKDVLYMLLYTGVRKTNALMMRWEQIDFVNYTWNIPETKNGDSQIVVLTLPAMKILMRRKQDSKSEWVFEGEGSKGYFSDPKKAWNRILKRSGIKELRIHDLRRTLGSWQAAMGANSYVIGKSLGHKSQEATAIYARLNLDPVRESVSKATEAMMLTTYPQQDSINVNDGGCL
ncbi:MAG: recombinase XerD [Alphaproteobacteria bacterium CG11_big_fil_rev_8_21_14_0_20_39_49]|nr:MAG: recombinase XerD [Alphaproteobacteria bacterium CG11_big_fil_rev_8_21_14_0_20_39_49]